MMTLYEQKHSQYHPNDTEALYTPTNEDIVLHRNRTHLVAKPFNNKYHWLICFTEKSYISNINDILTLVMSLYTEHNIDNIIVESRKHLWSRLLSRFKTDYRNIDNRDFYAMSIKDNIILIKTWLTATHRP